MLNRDGDRGNHPIGPGLMVDATRVGWQRRRDRGAWSGRRVSNPRHAAWKAAALPTELLPPGSRPPLYRPTARGIGRPAAAASAASGRREVRRDRIFVSGLLRPKWSAPTPNTGPMRARTRRIHAHAAASGAADSRLPSGFRPYESRGDCYADSNGGQSREDPRPSSFAPGSVGHVRDRRRRT